MPGQRVDGRRRAHQPRIGRHRADRNDAASPPPTAWTCAAARERSTVRSLLTVEQTPRASTFDVRRCRTTRRCTRPYFERASIAEPRYTVARRRAQFGRPAADAVAVARWRATRSPACRWRFDATVRRREPHLPYGEELRELMVVPAVAVNVAPRVGGRADRRSRARKQVEVRVELLNNAEEGGSGRLDAAAAGRMDVDAGRVAVRVRARRRARHLPLQRLGAVARERATTGSRRWRPSAASVSRGLRRHRAPRSRDAVSLSSASTISARRRRHNRAGPEGRLRDGRSATRCRQASRSSARGDAARRAGSGDRRSRAVRRDRDRHARLRRARGSEDLQPPPARLREERRQPDRALQHAGVRARTATRRSRRSCRRAPRKCRRRIRRSRSWPPSHQAFNDPEPDHEGRLRRLGGAARLEVLHRVGRGLHADDRDATTRVRRRREAAG